MCSCFDLLLLILSFLSSQRNRYGDRRRLEADERQSESGEGRVASGVVVCMNIHGLSEHFLFSLRLSSRIVLSVPRRERYKV